jgi:hypothetical protein
MLKSHGVSQSRIAHLLSVLALAAVASSCGLSEASSPGPAMDVLMQAVHDYGRSHQSSVLPPPFPIPQETDDDYEAPIKKLFLASDFTQLEKIAQQSRAERGLVRGGAWQNHDFYNVLGSSEVLWGEQTEEDYQKQITLLNNWIAAFPDSVTPRIALARLYLDYAYFVRGEGAADGVSDSQWKLYNQRNILAERSLLTAAGLKDRDPHWYEAMVDVAIQAGWDKPSELELLNQALAFEPSYYHYYRQHANYLEPQWYGEPGEIAKFAEETSLRLKDPDASILYFRITSTLACNCEVEGADLPSISWPKFKSGYVSVTRLYGKSNLNANRLAWAAYKFGDKAAAQEAFASMDHMEHDIWWSPETYAEAREWATTP